MESASRSSIDPRETLNNYRRRHQPCLFAGHRVGDEGRLNIKHPALAGAIELESALIHSRIDVQGTVRMASASLPYG
jgi:hypothetical protein